MSCDCRICGFQIETSIFSAHMLKSDVSYFECPVCFYVQTEEPFWLEEAYTNSINDCDTGLMVRNQNCARIVLGTLAALGKKQGRVVDWAGGYGVLTRLLRDQGLDAHWADPFSPNLFAKGFEYDGGTASLVTAFEAFEHFVSPTDELEKLFAIAPNLLISTEIIPKPTPASDNWWYYGLDHGQHIGFMRHETLEFVAAKFGKFLLSDGRSTHLFTDLHLSMSKWKLYIRLAKYLPKIVSHDLFSRTWSDFEKMSSSE